VTVQTWRLDRDDSCWVGPITYTVTTPDGVVVTDATIQFAVIPRGARPTVTDWVAPVANPDNTTEHGVNVGPVTGYGKWGVWVQAVRNAQTVILEPSQVGWIQRT
jgi:hypothetical protein